jgi:hypothetical protein
LKLFLDNEQQINGILVKKRAEAMPAGKLRDM